MCSIQEKINQMIESAEGSAVVSVISTLDIMTQLSKEGRDYITAIAKDRLKCELMLLSSETDTCKLP